MLFSSFVRYGEAPRAFREKEGGAPVIERGRFVIEDPVPEKPKMFRVMLWNSPMMDGAVVSKIIQEHFNKSSAQAWDLMVAAHRGGRSVLGIYTKEIAETRVARALEASRSEMQERYSMNGDLSLSVEEE